LQGVRLASLSKLPEQLEALRLWDGSPLPSGLRRRVLRVWAHHEFLSHQIAELEAERRAWLDSAQEASIEKVRQLLHLKGIGINGAWVLVMEFFAWREFKNRREVQTSTRPPGSSSVLVSRGTVGGHHGIISDDVS
jgi:transposase